MFHTPSISKVEKQAEVMKIPILLRKTSGEKELELKDLENIIKKAKVEYNIQGIVTGTVESAYQASRIQKICNNLDLDCFNPLWQKDQFELLNDMITNDFEIIITGVFAYPLDESWLGRIINREFLNDIKNLYEKYRINVCGEGGEFESYVIDCPLFEKKLEIIDKKISGKQNSWTMEIDIK
jgi:ABC transporter with metal-binding/Fe-S-binding domain ATP-binding protein